MAEAYGVDGIAPRSTLHGVYAEAIEERLLAAAEQRARADTRT